MIIKYNGHQSDWYTDSEPAPLLERHRPDDRCNVNLGFMDQTD